MDWQHMNISWLPTDGSYHTGTRGSHRKGWSKPYGIREHTGFSRLPCIMNDFLPKFGRIDFLHIGRFRRVDRILLFIRSSVDYGLHKFIIDLHRNVSPRHLPFRHLGIDKRFRIRMFDGNTKHQGTTTAVLGHFAGWIWVTFHKRNQSGRCQRRVLNRRSFRTNMW